MKRLIALSLVVAAPAWTQTANGPRFRTDGSVASPTGAYAINGRTGAMVAPNVAPTPHNFLATGQTAAQLTSGAIDAAPLINAALATGSAYLPCGTYSVQTTITFPSGSRLAGAGRCAVLRLDAAGSVGLLIDGVSDVSIERLAVMPGTNRMADDVRIHAALRTTLTGITWPRTSFDGAAAIHVMAATDTNIINAQLVTGSRFGFGILIDGDGSASFRTQIQQSTILGYMNGLRVTWAGETYVNQVNVTNAYLAGISIGPDGAHAIYGQTLNEEVDDTRLTQVRAANNIGDGLEVVGNARVSALSLSGFDGSFNGINAGDQSYSANGAYVANPALDGLSIVASNFQSNRGNGLYLEDGNNITVTGSSAFNNATAEYNGANGILVGSGASRASFTGNTVGAGGLGATGTDQRYGILCLSNDHILISSNMLSGNNVGALSVPNGGTVITANNITN